MSEIHFGSYEKWLSERKKEQIISESALDENRLSTAQMHLGSTRSESVRNDVEREDLPEGLAEFLRKALDKQT